MDRVENELESSSSSSNRVEFFQNKTIVVETRRRNSSGESNYQIYDVGSEWVKERRLEGEEHLSQLGFDTASFYEHNIAWGDLDPFRHVHNMHYVRFLESARLHWIMFLGREIGGEEKMKDMVEGRGISLALKEISLKFRRSVLFPDTLLIAHKPHDPHETQFLCTAAIWSFAQQRIVATSDSVLVWCDHEKELERCDPGSEYRRAIETRIERCRR